VSRKCKTSQAPASHRTALRSAASHIACGFRLNTRFKARDWERGESPPSPLWAVGLLILLGLVLQNECRPSAVGILAHSVACQATPFAANVDVLAYALVSVGSVCVLANVNPRGFVFLSGAVVGNPGRNTAVAACAVAAVRSLGSLGDQQSLRRLLVFRQLEDNDSLRVVFAAERLAQTQGADESLGYGVGFDHLA